MLALALLLANGGTYLQIISKQAYAATSAILLNSNSNIATITKVQLPGILPNNNDNENNNNNNPSTLTPTSPPTTNPSPANNNQGPATTTNIPTIVHRNTRARAAIGGPTLNDPNLKIEQVINTGLRSTTSMAFLGSNDILVLEKDAGIVHRILNGKMLPQPVLDVSVANVAERGLLGIAIAKNNDNGGTESGNVRHVFLYYTESGGGRDGDDEPSRTATTATTPDNSSRTNTGSRGLDTVPPAGNRLYRYDLDESGGNNTLRSGIASITQLKSRDSSPFDIQLFGSFKDDVDHYTLFAAGTPL